MSTSNIRGASESSSTAAGDPSARGMSRRQNTVSEQTSAGAIPASESQEIIAGLGLPFLAKVSKGRLNVSEASISAPQSADISASGRVFIPPHERAREEVSDPLHKHSGEAEVKARDTSEASEPLKEPREASSSQAEAEPALDLPDPAVVASAGIDREPKAEEADPSSTEQPSSTSLMKSENALEPSADPSPEVADTEPFSIPEIRIHRPSGTVMPACFEAAALKSANEPPTPVQTAMDQSPTTTPLKAVSNPVAANPAPSTLPSSPITITNAVPINAVTSTLPIPVSGLPVAGKIGKRTRVIRRARRVIVRKHLLAIILGRDLANVVHPQLNAAGETVPEIPLSLDGPSDLVRSYGRQNEHKRAVQQRQADQKMASARMHAEAEEIQRCPACRGLKRTSYLRKYHRLQLQRDKPTMGVIERHATSRAQVAAFKCHCKRQLLGAEGEEEARDSARPPAPQHLRTPDANRSPLPGVLEDTLR